MTPEQLLDGFGSHLVERAYILSLRRRCEEAEKRLEEGTDLSHEDWEELEEEHSLLRQALTWVNTLAMDQEYLTQE